VVAAKLLFLKTRSLLPQPQPPLDASEDGDDDIGQDLVDQLLDYRRFRDAAQELRVLQEQGQTYPRLAPPRLAPSGPGLAGITLDSLLNLVRQALERHQPLPTGTVAPEPWRLEDKLAHLGGEVLRHRRLSFRAVLESCQSRAEIVVTFLALLELIKAGRVQVAQEESFGDILISAPEGAAS